jgi:hypothetical protein
MLAQQKCQLAVHLPTLVHQCLKSQKNTACGCKEPALSGTVRLFTQRIAIAPPTYRSIHLQPSALASIVQPINHSPATSGNKSIQNFCKIFWISNSLAGSFCSPLEGQGTLAKALRLIHHLVSSYLSSSTFLPFRCFKKTWLRKVCQGSDQLREPHPPHTRIPTNRSRT